jgi:hypothetical protein
MSDKINLENLKEEELAMIEKIISNKLIDIINKANIDANLFLKDYGIQARMVLELTKKE